MVGGDRGGVRERYKMCLDSREEDKGCGPSCCCSALGPGQLQQAWRPSSQVDLGCFQLPEAEPSILLYTCPYFPPPPRTELYTTDTTETRPQDAFKLDQQAEHGLFCSATTIYPTSTPC